MLLSPSFVLFVFVCLFSMNYTSAMIHPLVQYLFHSRISFSHLNPQYHMAQEELLTRSFMFEGCCLQTNAAALYTTVSLCIAFSPPPLPPPPHNNTHKVFSSDLLSLTDYTHTGSRGTETRHSRSSIVDMASLSERKIRLIF